MEFSEGKRFALLIGNNNYQDISLNDLRAPHHDVQLLKSLLLDKRIGRFDKVEDLIDCNYNLLRERIEKFFTGKKAEDLLLFYFSGHGMVDDQNELCLVCKETEIDLLHATSLHASFIKRQMERSKAQQQILLLDSCFSGAFSGSIRSPQIWIEKYFIDSSKVSTSNASARHVKSQGKVVITASSKFEFAHEGGRFDKSSPPQSWFTSSLIEGIKTGQADRDQDGLIEIHELYEFIYDKLQGKGQKPTYTDTEREGIIWIAKNPNNLMHLQRIEKLLFFKQHDIREILTKLLETKWSRLEDYESALRIARFLGNFINEIEDEDKLRLYKFTRRMLKEPLEQLACHRERSGQLDGAIAVMYILNEIEPENESYKIKIQNLQKQQLLFAKYQEADQFFNKQKYEQAARMFADIACKDPHYKDVAEKLYLSVTNSLPNGVAPSVKLEEPVNKSSTINRIKVRIIFSVLLIFIFVQIFLTILLYIDLWNNYNISILSPIIIIYIFCTLTIFIALGWIILQELHNYEK